MLKFWHDEVWAFDAEWCPDPLTIRRLYGDDAIRKDDYLKKSTAPITDEDAIEHAYRQAKDYDPTTNPRPFLKTVLCRVISIGVAVWRRRFPTVAVRCFMGDEGEIIGKFLQGIGTAQPMLVGFASRNADLPILLQRGLAHGVQCSVFASRSQMNDYFHKYGGWHVDLCETLGGYGSSTPKLAEVCAAAGIPGKGGVDGSQVADLLQRGEVETIRTYQEGDALSTLALFLRLMYMAGKHPTGRFSLDERTLERHPDWRSYVLPAEVAA